MLLGMDERPLLSGAFARKGAETAARQLARDPRVSLVYLFGSAAQPGSRSVRDIDLGLMTDPAVPLGELMRWRADLVIATKVPIDLTSLNEAPIVLAHEVVEGGVCLYAKGPEIETEFVTRIRARYWDFKPYRDEQWRLAEARLTDRLHGS